MTHLWTAEEAARATGGRAIGDWAVDGVSIDTRTIAAGDLFVALKDVRDGHDFVAQALANGAGAAMVSRVPDGVADDAPLLIVDDVLPALERLGVAARARTDARVVAVTGSVGKTSTKEMLRLVLGGQGRVHAAEASYNNHWGVPLTLARMPADTEFAVIEIGMSNPGEIAPLAKLARPHVALITTVAAAHLEAFDDLSGIAREKATIFEGLEPNGIAIINADLEVTPILDAAADAVGAKKVHFGTARGTPYHLDSVDMRADTTIVRAALNGASFLFKLGTMGRHFAMNALAVLAVGDQWDIDPALAAVDLSAWRPVGGRGTRERIILDDVEDGLWFDMFDDAFNANPTSLQAALQVLAAATPDDGVGRIAKGRRVAVLGDMLELGPEELDLHRAVADDPALKKVDVVHCVGPRMRALYDVLPAAQRGNYAPSADEMVKEAHAIVDAGDVLLIKGSKGSKVSRVVDALRKLGHPVATDE